MYPLEHHEEMSGKLDRSKKGSSSSADSDGIDEKLSKRSRNNNDAKKQNDANLAIFRGFGGSVKNHGGILDQAEPVVEEELDGEIADPGVHLDPTMMVSSSDSNGDLSSRQSSVDSTTSTGFVKINIPSLLHTSNVAYDQGRRKSCYAYTIASAVRMMQRCKDERVEETKDLVDWITGKLCFGNLVYGGYLEKYLTSFAAKYQHWTMHKLPEFTPNTGILRRVKESTFKKSFSTFCEELCKHKKDHLVHMISLWFTEREWNAFKAFHSYELPSPSDVNQVLDTIVANIQAHPLSSNFTADEIKFLMHLCLNSDSVEKKMPGIMEKVHLIASLHDPRDLALPENATILDPHNFSFDNVIYDKVIDKFVDEDRNHVAFIAHDCIVYNIESDSLTIKNSWGEKWGFIGGKFRVSYNWLNELYKKHRVLITTMHSSHNATRDKLIPHTSGKITDN